MPACPQCHATFDPEDLDAQNPRCPVCDEPLSESGDETKAAATQDHDASISAPKIEGFEITRHIGRGGMGDVWEARQLVLGRKVAIKVLAQNLSHSEHFLARFTREAYTLGRLHHPGIVGIHDFRSNPDGLCCIIMEYVEGPNRGDPTTLHDLIRARELDVDRTRFLILQVLHSLQYAHEEGVIHRDIKPTNVLIDRNGRVKVVDFGIAAMPGDRSGGKQLTYAGGPLGTAEYMAPEQTEDATQADHRADLFAVGVVIYEMLTGTRPRGAFAPPSQAKPGIDAAWDAVVQKALQPEREKRYADAREMIAAIQLIRGAATAGPLDEVPPEYLPASPALLPAPVRERPFEEPEDFAPGKTPLPINTPTVADPARPESVDGESGSAERSGATDLPSDEDDEEIPPWLVKRREREKALKDTQVHSSAEDSENALDFPEPSNADSAVRIDKRVAVSDAEPSGEVPAANAEDLAAWLADGPIPGSAGSSHLLEIAAHLAPTKEGLSEDEPSEPAGESKADDRVAAGSPTGAASGTATEDVPTDDKSPISDDLPEGDFVELATEAGVDPPCPGDKAMLFRPANRPPVIKICVLDDGSGREGEWFRIRQPSFVIGRNEGDLIISHDKSISGRHAEIRLEQTGDSLFELLIRDLNTTNGTFARASRAILEDGQEFLLGCRRYKLVCNCPSEAGGPPFDQLQEITKKGRGKTLRLGRPPVTIGRDPMQCDLLVLDDPFLSPLHAVLKRDDKNRWVIKNYNSRNGVWIQIEEMQLVSGGEFQIGSQRFIVQIP